MNREQQDLLDGRHLQGWYANYFEVGHNQFEFVLDFGQCGPESEATHLHTRIITSPIYAKALLVTLRDSIDRYEQAFGSIELGEP